MSPVGQGALQLARGRGAARPRHQWAPFIFIPAPACALRRAHVPVGRGSSVRPHLCCVVVVAASCVTRPFREQQQRGGDGCVGGGARGASAGLCRACRRRVAAARWAKAPTASALGVPRVTAWLACCRARPCRCRRRAPQERPLPLPLRPVPLQAARTACSLSYVVLHTCTQPYLAVLVAVWPVCWWPVGLSFGDRFLWPI